MAKAEAEREKRAERGGSQCEKSGQSKDTELFQRQKSMR
jgi:hypothetical protein